MAIAVSVSPTSATEITQSTLQLTATVTGSAGQNKGVTWSIVSGTGTVNSSGLYTANYVGTDVVKATSVEDPTKTATCTITVKGAALITSAPSAINPGDATFLSAVILGYTVQESGTWSLVSGTGYVNSTSGLYEAGIAGTDVIKFTPTADPTIAVTCSVTVAKGANGQHKVLLDDQIITMLIELLNEKLQISDGPRAVQLTKAIGYLQKFGGQ